MAEAAVASASAVSALDLVPELPSVAASWTAPALEVLAVLEVHEPLERPLDAANRFHHSEWPSKVVSDSLVDSATEAAVELLLNHEDQRKTTHRRKNDLLVLEARLHRPCGGTR